MPRIKIYVILITVLKLLPRVFMRKCKLLWYLAQETVLEPVLIITSLSVRLIWRVAIYNIQYKTTKWNLDFLCNSESSGYFTCFGQVRDILVRNMTIKWMFPLINKK